MTILADRLQNRTDCANYALGSHDVKAGELRTGDMLDIGHGARIVRIDPMVAGMVMVSAVTADGDRRVRSYGITDTVSVLV